MNYKYVFLITAILSLLITAVILKYLIPFLMSKKIGQRILDIGPRWHKNKEGTPTMGGISFIVACLICFIVFSFIYYDKSDDNSYLCALNIVVYALLNAMIGLIDDIAKMRKAKNEGLTAIQKYLFQSIIAVLFLISMHYTIGLDTNLYIPFFNKTVDIGFWYYILAYFILCGIVNSVNLSDGVDGLAATLCLTVGLFFAFSDFTLLENSVIGFYSGFLIGATLGFLLYNLYPARVFMGDTGSLFLGAIIVGISFVTNNILLVLVYGLIFVIEALSDILQVAYFKISGGKRIFKMAPLHHHFEKCGWSEMKVVCLFGAVNSVFCIIAYFGLGAI